MTSSDIFKRASDIHEDIRTWRRTIHKQPELSFTENQTSQVVQDVLKDLGVEYQANVAKTGVVATIPGTDGANVGLRADMDALPIQEENGTDFDSERPGIMHACGHDAHTAMLLGAATVLKGMADEGQLPGTVRLLFQPSEEAWDDEGKSGGRRMVEEGALDALDAVFGLHVDSREPTGVIATREGPLLSAVDDFKLELTGAGGHAAHPHKTTDVIAMSGLIINAIHQVVSRRLNPTESGVISITTINGGHASNVIDTNLTMRGTIRSLSAEGRQTLHAELKRACDIAKVMGGDYKLSINTGYPVTENDPEATATVFRALNKLVGEKHTRIAPISMGAEDFSYMAQSVPGCFMMLGVKHPNWQQEYPVHTPTFRLDEDALPLGTAALVGSALEWMSR